MSEKTLVELAKKGSSVFLNPGREFPWTEIVNGLVLEESGSSRKFYAVAPNTFRSFHRIDKSKPGAFPAFKQFFTDEKDAIISRLSGISNRHELHDLENEIAESIRVRLWNIKPDRISSYNKMRKPIDLYIEHLVAMASELSSVRSRLIPLLLLPLDSQMISSDLVFSQEELHQAALSRSSTYSHVENRQSYMVLQQTVEKKAIEVSRRISRHFYPIYFDLLWNKRYCRKGSFLFELN